VYEFTTVGPKPVPLKLILRTVPAKLIADTWAFGGQVMPAAVGVGLAVGVRVGVLVGAGAVGVAVGVGLKVGVPSSTKKKSMGVGEPTVGVKVGVRVGV
jgi:hypothetical protein